MYFFENNTRCWIRLQIRNQEFWDMKQVGCSTSRRCTSPVLNLKSLRAILSIEKSEKLCLHWGLTLFELWSQFSTQTLILCHSWVQQSRFEMISHQKNEREIPDNKTSSTEFLNKETGASHYPEPLRLHVLHNLCLISLCKRRWPSLTICLTVFVSPQSSPENSFAINQIAKKLWMSSWTILNWL